MKIDQILSKESPSQLRQRLMPPVTKPPKKRRKKIGRPKKRRLFEETKLGYYLKMEVPFEYNLIMEACSRGGYPSADLIEAIGYASLNVFFKKPEFRWALIEYRKTGLYPKTLYKSSVRKELHYINVRKENMQRNLQSIV